MPGSQMTAAKAKHNAEFQNIFAHFTLPFYAICTSLWTELKLWSNPCYYWIYNLPRWFGILVILPISRCVNPDIDLFPVIMR